MDEVSRLQGGDANSFNLFYREYVDEISRYVKMFLKSDVLTEDVTQDVFIKFWENSFKFESVDNIRGFLYSTAKNNCLNILKRSLLDDKLMVSILNNYELEPSVDFLIYRKEYREYIDKVLNTVPEQSRVVFRMCKIEGRSYEEVAEQLNISKNTVKKHIVRTLSVLRNDKTLNKMNKNLVYFYCFLRFMQN